MFGMNPKIIAKKAVLRSKKKKQKLVLSEVKSLSTVNRKKIVAFCIVIKLLFIVFLLVARNFRLRNASFLIQVFKALFDFSDSIGTGLQNDTKHSIWI
jgi:hypothetical protein